MKKNVLALSIAAMIGGLGFAGAASAVVLKGSAAGSATVSGYSLAAGAETMTIGTGVGLSVDAGGTGHALVVPYFNAQNGNMTVLHVVNTDTARGKAVKVRFRGAANSDDVLDFQVFMSPGDVWTAAVTQGADGVAQLVTADNTCTLPKLSAGVPQSFITGRLNPKLDAAAKANQTREGYVEIFNMADIPENATTGSLFKAIKHTNGVATCAQANLDATLVDYADEKAAAKAGFDTPSGGLMGDWYIINVAQTTTFSGAATAIAATGTANAFTKRVHGNFIHFPQLDSKVGGLGVDAYTADPLFRSDSLDAATAAAASLVTAGSYDLPDLSTPIVGAAPIVGTDPAAVPATVGGAEAKAQAALLTAALAVKSITNQYANDASITAKTDWVFSMPTRRYSVAANYAATSSAVPAYRVFTDLGATNYFTAANTSVSGDLICVKANGQSFWDREEANKTSGAVFSPGTVSVTTFCGETSVLRFADSGKSVLGADVAVLTVAPGYVNGWSNIDITNGGAGFPVLGSSFIKLTNPQASAGMSGTYGITWPHRFTK